MPTLFDRFPQCGDSTPESAVLVRNTPQSFSAALHVLFDRAARVAGEVSEFQFDIGGSGMCMRFAGPSMVPRITPAFAHRAHTNPTASLIVHVWDETATGVSVRDLSQTVGIDKLAATDPDVLLSFEPRANEAFYWVRDGASLPLWEHGAPLRPLLHWWLSQSNRHLVHAAAVGIPNAGAMLGGPSGRGKSTTALACIGSSLTYVGDDYVLLSPDPNPTVHSLYRSAKLHGAHAQRFPHLLRFIRNHQRQDNEKALMFLDREHSQESASGIPLHAVLVPHVTGLRHTSVCPLDPAAALRAMAPSTLFQLPGVGPATFQCIADLTRRVPCFQLELGTELDQVPHVIAALLESSATNN